MSLQTPRMVDAFTHVLPPQFFKKIADLPQNQGIAKRIGAIPMLYDIDRRTSLVKQWPGYSQVISLSQPSADTLAGPEHSPALARIGNDGLAQLVDRHRACFPAFVASLPMNNVEAAVEEFDRVVLQLGAKGVQIDTNINGLPLDDPRFFPVFERAVHHDVPIWLHPYRGPDHADYKTEEKSRFEIWQVLGWPYETSVAMARIVFSGILTRLPGLKIITHHLGAMAPFFEGRIGPLWDQIGSRTADEDLSYLKDMLGRPPIDYFRMFYGDTAVGGSSAAIRCGLEFFGDEQVVFASDCPFDPEGGAGFIRDTIAAIDKLSLSDEARHQVYYGNIARLLKLD